MFKQLVLSIRMTAAAFGMVFRYPQVLVLPLCTLLVVATAIVAPIWYGIYLLETEPQTLLDFFRFVFQIPLGYVDQGDYSTGWTALLIEFYVLWALWLSFVTFVTLFFQTAAMHTGTMLVKRERPSLLAGLGLAWRNKWRLLALAVVSATLVVTVHYLLRNVFRVLPIVGKWLYRAFAFTISAGVYLVLPVVVYERNGAWSGIKRSAHLLKETWGGILIGTGMSFTALYLVAYVIPMGTLVFALNVQPPLWVFGAYAIVLWAFLYCLNHSLSAMLRAALYWYATTGETPYGMAMDFVPAPQNAGAMRPAEAPPGGY